MASVAPSSLTSAVSNELSDVYKLGTDWQSFGSPLATSFGIEHAGDRQLVFHGTGFGSYSGNFPTTGTVTSVDVLTWNGSAFVQSASWTGFNADASVLSA